MDKNVLSALVILAIIQLIGMISSIWSSRGWKSYWIWFNNSNDAFPQMCIALFICEIIVAMAIGLFKIVNWFVI